MNFSENGKMQFNQRNHYINPGIMKKYYFLLTHLADYQHIKKIEELVC